MKLNIISGIAVAAIALFSCTESDDLNIGSSLTAENDKVSANSSTFTVSSRTLPIGNVLSRSNESYFGCIQDPETGATVTSEFMSQFSILETFSFPAESKVLSHFDDKVCVDSCYFDVYFFNPASCSDSMAVLKMKITEMSQPAEETTDYYSNFDPAEAGLLREDGLVLEKSFSLASTQTISSSSGNRLAISADVPYTDKEGVSYKNYGTYIMQQYYKHPEYFRNSYSFIHHVCPGFSYQLTDGSGFYSKVPYVGLRLYFNMEDSDSTFVGYVALAGTDEVLQTTKISNDTTVLSQLINDNSCTYLKTPVGLLTEVTLPIDDIIRGHENDSLLAASISFPRVNNSEQDNHNLDIPRNLLLVQKDSLENFFLNNKLTDNETSYLNNTTTNSSGKTVLDLRNTYTYDNISSLITHMANAKRQGQKQDGDWVLKHPDWNRFVLIPVTLIQTTTSSYYGTSATTTGIRHNMALTSTKLVGGSENSHEPIKLSVVYAKYKTE